MKLLDPEHLEVLATVAGHRAFERLFHPGVRTVVLDMLITGLSPCYKWGPTVAMDHAVSGLMLRHAGIDADTSSPYQSSRTKSAPGTITVAIVNSLMWYAATSYWWCSSNAAPTLDDIKQDLETYAQTHGI